MAMGSRLFYLERQVSHIETYQKSYSMMLQMWQHILAPVIHNAEHTTAPCFDLIRISYRSYYFTKFNEFRWV